jgi:hypothetical protein
MSWLTKGLSSLGSFAKKGLSAVNYVGNEASSLAHFAIDNKYAQAALAVDPEMAIAVNGGLASADGFLKESNALETYLTPAEEPAKSSSDGLEKKRPTVGLSKKQKDRERRRMEEIGSGRILPPTGAPPMKSGKRPDWSFDQGYSGKGGFNSGKGNLTFGIAPAKPYRPDWGFVEGSRRVTADPTPKSRKKKRYRSA